MTYSHSKKRNACRQTENRIPGGSSDDDDDENGESICDMKPFDSFGGSDSDTSDSSMSEMNLKDAFDEAAEDAEGSKNAPQCIGKVALTADANSEVEFSFQPRFVKVGAKVTKSKKMYISKRLGNKVSAFESRMMSTIL